MRTSPVWTVCFENDDGIIVSPEVAALEKEEIRVSGKGSKSQRQLEDDLQHQRISHAPDSQTFEEGGLYPGYKITVKTTADLK